MGIKNFIKILIIILITLNVIMPKCYAEYSFVETDFNVEEEAFAIDGEELRKGKEIVEKFGIPIILIIMATSIVSKLKWDFKITKLKKSWKR